MSILITLLLSLGMSMSQATAIENDTLNAGKETPEGCVWKSVVGTDGEIYQYLDCGLSEGDSDLQLD